MLALSPSPLPAEGRAAASSRSSPTPELLAELAEASAGSNRRRPRRSSPGRSERFAPYLTMATAFGPEGCVIISMLAEIAPETHVFNLDTGYQFQETLDLRDRSRASTASRSRCCSRS